MHQDIKTSRHRPDHAQKSVLEVHGLVALADRLARRDARLLGARLVVTVAVVAVAVAGAAHLEVSKYRG